MPENFIALPDGKRLVIFETDRHPDFKGTVINIQETLLADIPSYMVVADNVATAINTNLLSVFNNLSATVNKRIRIQHIYCYPRSTAANTVTLQVGYSNVSPAGGTEANFTRMAADFDDRPAAPNTVLTKVGSTTNPIAGIILGGTTLSLNDSFKTYDLFKKDANYSAIQLRPQPNAEGIIVRQVAGSNTGTLTIHVVFTLD